MVGSRALLRSRRRSLVVRDGSRLLGPPRDCPLQLGLLPAPILHEPFALPRHTVHRLREPAVEREALLQPGGQLVIVRNCNAHRGRVRIRRGPPRVHVVHLREPRVRPAQPRQDIRLARHVRGDCLAGPVVLGQLRLEQVVVVLRLGHHLAHDVILVLDPPHHLLDTRALATDSLQVLQRPSERRERVGFLQGGKHGRG